jgi:protoporphyrinogen oxidase
MPAEPMREPVVIVGAGFCGLAAAWELLRAGVPVTVVESDAALGGLAGGFEVGGEILEKFYHHWFTSDVEIRALIDELGLGDRVVLRESRTGLWYANTLFRLSRPLDVLRFRPLSLPGRLRLGLLALKARAVRDWRALESISARDWLISLGGREVYEVVWEPLLKGKFGAVADDVSAVWFWNKLCLRGGSRDKAGREVLAYYRGGFMGLAEALGEAIRRRGGRILTRTRVTGIAAEGGRIRAVRTEAGEIACSAMIATPALPEIAAMLEGKAGADYDAALRRIGYLANVCLVLQLDRSLSDTYWVNVNDGEFPFVGIIEHTNFESPATYGGRHIVYLSKYLPKTDRLYSLSDAELLRFSVPHIRRMFPKFDESWVLDYNVWRAEYAQPIVGLHYSKQIPPTRAPLAGAYLATMAQIYPEDRGTNYAVREGRKVGRLVAADLRDGAAARLPAASGSVAGVR